MDDSRYIKKGPRYELIGVTENERNGEPIALIVDTQANFGLTRDEIDRYKNDPDPSSMKYVVKRNGVVAQTMADLQGRLADKDPHDASSRPELEKALKAVEAKHQHTLTKGKPVLREPLKSNPFKPK